MCIFCYDLRFVVSFQSLRARLTYQEYILTGGSCRATNGHVNSSNLELRFSTGRQQAVISNCDCPPDFGQENGLR